MELTDSGISEKKSNRANDLPIGKIKPSYSFSSAEELSDVCSASSPIGVRSMQAGETVFSTSILEPSCKILRVLFFNVTETEHSARLFDKKRPDRNSEKESPREGDFSTLSSTGERKHGQSSLTLNIADNMLESVRLTPNFERRSFAEIFSSIIIFLTAKIQHNKVYWCEFLRLNGVTCSDTMSFFCSSKRYFNFCSGITAFAGYF